MKDVLIDIVDGDTHSIVIYVTDDNLVKEVIESYDGTPPIATTISYDRKLFTGKYGERVAALIEQSLKEDS